MTSPVPEAAIAQIGARQLNRAVLIAIASAALIVTTVVLPAEYGVDPTGAGSLLGLTQMGAMKAAQAGDGTAPAGPIAGDSVTQAPDGTRRVQIVIGPYGGREVKAVMAAGAELTYEWSTDGEAVEFEFHGDPKVPKMPGEYTSYEKGTKSSASGTFRAGFAGNHGWFWKNLTARPVVITATVKGTVEKLKLHGQDTRFNAIKFMPEVVAGNVFKENTAMSVYVSNDKNRIPLLIESPVSVGSIKAVLKDYSGLRHELSAKIN